MADPIKPLTPPEGTHYGIVENGQFLSLIREGAVQTIAFGVNPGWVIDGKYVNDPYSQ